MKVSKRFFVILFIFTFLFSYSSFCYSSYVNPDLQLKEYSIKSLVEGIKSSNEGLSKSCIYFAGKYKIEAAVNALIEKVRKESDPKTKILIAIALYQIGDLHGIFEVDKMGINDPDLHVREVCKNIYNEYLSNELGLFF